MPSTKAKSRPCVVTTEHRGVFFGFCEAEDTTARTVTLTEAQMCVYWSSDVQGVVGLAVSGPSKSSRVTPPAPRLTLTGTTAVMDATEDAVKAWKERPWR